MGKFLDAEKNRYLAYKQKTEYLSNPAKEPGIYRGKLRPFCLPIEYAEENLYEGIRRPALDYFEECGIKWHDGGYRRPSNHLCSSQVCCVNFLFPFAGKPAALAALIQPLFPNILEMLSIEPDGQYVSMEWIGLDNYLGEKAPRSGSRTRGANFTSADAMVMFRRTDGLKQTVLIEWKYTESYSNTNLRWSKAGTDRAAIYRDLYERDDFPLDKKRLPGFEALFYEPFYQLLRQQLLANEMERAEELGTDIVSLLHISPAQNHDFSRVTSPKLRSSGKSVLEMWKYLLVIPSRFQKASIEELFTRFPLHDHRELSQWWAFVTDRYSWLQNVPTGHR